VTAAACVWLYAVVPAGPSPGGGGSVESALAAISGVADEPLYLVPGPGVAAVAGAVPCEDFDEEPLRTHLADVTWLERTVRIHHGAVDALVRAGPVLPMRYATVYREESSVAAMLETHRERLAAALERITGRTEWGVKVYLAHRSATESDGARPADQSSPGTAYLLRRKAQRDDRLQTRQRAGEEADRIHEALAAAAVENARHPLQTAEASGRGEPMVLNGAYLVDDERLPAFEKAVASCAADHGALRVEVTGPWPAYSFTDIGELPEGE